MLASSESCECSATPMKTPRSREKEMTGSMSPLDAAARGFFGISALSCSHKTVQTLGGASSRSGFEVVTPSSSMASSAPTPGWMRFTKMIPVTIARKLVVR